VGNGSPPVAEHGFRLLRGPFLARDVEDVMNIRGQRIRLRIWVRSHRKPHASQVVVLVIVAVPSPMPLVEINDHRTTVRIWNWLFGKKDSLAGLVTLTRTHVDAPRCFIYTVDGVSNGTRHPMLAGFVVESRGDRRFRRIHIG